MWAFAELLACFTSRDSINCIGFPCLWEAASRLGDKSICAFPVTRAHGFGVPGFTLGSLFISIPLVSFLFTDHLHQVSPNGLYEILVRMRQDTYSFFFFYMKDGLCAPL